MNPIVFAMKHPITAMMSVVALVGGGFFAYTKMRVDFVPLLKTRKIYDPVRVLAIFPSLIPLSLPACHMRNEEPHQEHHKIVATSPEVRDVILTQPYVCQIHSQRHINVQALVDGYLDEILVKEGQAVKEGDLMFKILPVLYQAKYEAAKAEARLAELEFNYTKSLYQKNVVSENEVALHQAKMEKAKAQAKLEEAKLKFTDVRARFDGIVDTLHEREGSLIKERDILTTLSDNSVMWVYFNVPEASYLEYMAHRSENREDPRIELKLANGNIFPYTAKSVTIEAKFNNEIGVIPFRADFENPDRLLRHGQTGTVLIHQTLHNALVIPQRATFEVIDKRYVYVVDKDDVVHPHEIVIDKNELEDIFVIKSGLDVKDKIVLEGVRELRNGEKVEYEFRPPEQALKNLKYHAE